VFQRLLLGMDDRPAGQIGVSFATALARQHTAAVRVLYVNQFVVGGRGHTVLTSDEANQLIAGAVDELLAHGVPATGEVLRANCFDMAPRIVDAALRWRADAIVVGSHRRRGRHFLSGGVRERVMRLSALPILTAPAPLEVSRLQTSMLGSPPQPISRRMKGSINGER
jgi:nucleotide-binding universal stress UspA family protein